MSAATDLGTSEREVIRQHADWYSQQGYQVSVEPSPRELPEFLRTLAPDLIARRDGENIVVEIKTSSPAVSTIVVDYRSRRPAQAVVAQNPADPPNFVVGSAEDAADRGDRRG
ncbi:MAG: hypothetical protein ACJ8AH_14435 [Stellaceae bacterium]|jgi:indole-3-glycerol phosphate synthase